MESTNRSQFTMVGLLVAFVLIGLATGLTLTALQTAREAARRNQCTDHLKQLALGCHGFHDVNDYLPPARLSQEVASPIGKAKSCDNTDAACMGPNWAVVAMPYYLADGLYFDELRVSLKGITSQAPDYASSTGTATATGLTHQYKWFPDATSNDGSYSRGSRYAVHQCPSDYGHEVPYSGKCGYFEGHWARGNYAINAGPCELMVGGVSSTCAMNGNVLPFSTANKPNGLPAAGIAEVNWGVKLATLSTKDGLGSTVMLAEIRVGLSPEDIRGTWMIGLPGASILANAAVSAVKGPNSKVAGGDIVTGCSTSIALAGDAQALASMRFGCMEADEAGSIQAGARSRHPYGVNVANADGSVHFIADKISYRQWYRMLSYLDGGDALFEID